jgi:hypothetical protein
MDTALDTDASGQPGFLTTAWSLVPVASSESSAQAGVGAGVTLSPSLLSGLRGSSTAPEIVAEVRTMASPAEIDEEFLADSGIRSGAETAI